MKRWVLGAALAAVAGAGQAAAARPELAEPPVLPMSQTEAAHPAMPALLTQRERAAVVDDILAERLDTIVPRLMREQGFDMWILVAREYLEDPVVATMLNAESLRARRRTILVFFDAGHGKPVERLTVSRYDLGGLFLPVWDPARQPDQWKALAELVARRAPKRIAVNVSGRTAFGDGLTHSQYSEMMAAFDADLRRRVTPNDTLAVGWLETRSPTEMKIYPGIVRLAHAILAEGLSARTIRPGVTTTADVEWFLRERMARLGVDTWFHPSVGVQRQGVAELLEGDTVIRKGDLVWTDFGITYLRLNTDTQHLAYVLKDGERDAPAGLKAGLRAANAIQDALTSSFRTGASGNDILAAARAKARAAGLKPSIYSHPLGYHGHGAGPSIGFWDNQNPDPRGDGPVRPSTVWSIELSAFATVPEWGGQEVQFRTEEDAFFDGASVRYLDGRQTELTLIGRR